MGDVDWVVEWKQAKDDWTQGSLLIIGECPLIGKEEWEFCVSQGGNDV